VARSSFRKYKIVTKPQCCGLLERHASPRISRAGARWLGARDGQAAVEFAVILPVLVLLLTGIVDLGSLIVDQMRVTAAAEAGAQYAMVNGFNATNIATAVTNATSGASISASPAPTQTSECVSSTFTLTPPPGANCTGTDAAGGSAPGTFVFVHATAPVSPILPVWGALMPSSVTANAAVMISQP
jgi:Flp pilus assembly protein TadG